MVLSVCLTVLSSRRWRLWRRESSHCFLPTASVWHQRSPFPVMAPTSGCHGSPSSLCHFYVVFWSSLYRLIVDCNRNGKSFGNVLLGWLADFGDVFITNFLLFSYACRHLFSVCAKSDFRLVGLVHVVFQTVSSS